MSAMDVGVLWDLDGSLVDTEPVYFRAYAAVAESLGAASPWTDADHAAILLGRPAPAGATAFLAALRKRGPLIGDGTPAAATPASVLAARDARTAAAFATCTLMPGAHVAVAACTARGLRQGVATSAARASATLKTSGHPLLHPLLAAGVCSDDAVMAGRPGKPAPDIFLAAASALGLPATRCVAIEDSLAGMRAARAAGCFVIAVPDPRLNPSDVASAGPDVVLPSLEHFSLDLVTVEARVAALRKEALMSGGSSAVAATAGTSSAAAAAPAERTAAAAAVPPLRFFFYGSLRTGKCNHGFLGKRLRRCVRVGAAASLESEFYLLGLRSRAFPYLTRIPPPSPSGSASDAPAPDVAPAPACVVGEVFEVDADDDEGLRHLDDLEFGYSQREILVHVEGEPAPSLARVYLLEDVAEAAKVWAGVSTGDYFLVPGCDWSGVGQ